MPQYESPLNKLADSLPGFLLQMQEIKLRQDTQEALSSYRTSLLAERIESNRIAQDARDALGIKRGQEERENILEARGKYGEAGARGIYPEAVERHFPQGLPEEKEEKEKGIKPSAGDIAFARKRKTTFQTTIDTETAKITQMQQKLKLGPGEKPKKPGGFGRRKEQTDLDNWNKAHKTLRGTQASLDSLEQDATKRGIDLEFGAQVQPTQIQTLEEFNALPSGALFIDPDTGEEKRKP